MKNILGRPDAVAREVFALGHDADADPVVVQRDVPKPAFLRQERHGGHALVNALVALGAFVIGPNGDLVEFGIGHAPAVARRGERLLAGAVKRDRRAMLGLGAVWLPHAHASHPIAIPQQIDHLGFLDDVGALVPRVVE